MKVGIVINTSWNIYNFRNGLIRSFLEKGIKVYAIAPVDSYSEKLRAIGCHHIPVKIESQNINPFKDILLTIRLFRIYRKIKPDVILHYTIKPNIYGTLAANMLNIPVVNNVCGLGTVFLRQTIISAIARILYKVTFRYPQKIFFQNPDDKAYFLAHKLVREEITDLLPGSGIDTESFTPVSFMRHKPFTFLMISRLLIDKGIREYLEAAALLREKGLNARFQLLGADAGEHPRGWSERKLKSLIKDDSVEYLGTTEDVRPVIEASDCVVLPSYREGTPRTLLEAASMGKPLIGTNVAGCNQVIKHNINGFLCEAGNTEDLAGKMQHMVGLDDGELKRLGAESRQRTEKKFDEKIVIKKYLEIIESITKNPSLKWSL